MAIEKVCVKSQEGNQFLNKTFLVKKGWEQQTCYQPEKTVPIYPIKPFQNGESTFNKRHLKKKQVYVQVRLCIPLSEDSRK